MKNKTLYKYFILSFLLAIGNLPVFAFCGSDPCLLKGQVTDAITKKPVSGVVVSAVTNGVTNAREAVTDNEGFFYFKELPGNQVNLRFNKKGYVGFKSRSVSVKEKTTVKMDVEVSPVGDSFSDDSEFPLLRMLDVR